MKRIKWIGAAIMVCFALQVDLFAGIKEGSGVFQLHNRLRVEYDDNVKLTENDEQSSFKIIEELEFYVNFNLDQTFVSLRYRPSYIWWEDRDNDDSDLHHDLDVVLNHSFTPRLSLSAKNTFRLAELPELVDRGATVRENDDYIYNTISSTLSYLFARDTHIKVNGGYVLLRYDDDSVAAREDYDLYEVGTILSHKIKEETEVSGEFRFETIDYDVFDRGSDSIQVGVGIEHTFSPNFLGSLRTGWQHKEFNAANTDSDDTPYVDASITLIPSPGTRLTTGVGYSFYETDVFPFTNQERLRFFSSLAQEISARINWYLTGSYTLSSLDAADALADAGPSVIDGDEDIVQISTRVTYRINRSNLLELGWQFASLDSDVRVEDYDRNRISLGWKTEIGR